MMTIPYHTLPLVGMTIPYLTIGEYDQRDPDCDPPAQLRDGGGFLEAPDPPHPLIIQPYPALLHPLYNASPCLFIQTSVSP